MMEKHADIWTAVCLWGAFALLAIFVFFALGCGVVPPTYETKHIRVFCDGACLRPGDVELAEKEFLSGVVVKGKIDLLVEPGPQHCELTGADGNLYDSLCNGWARVWIYKTGEVGGDMFVRYHDCTGDTALAHELGHFIAAAESDRDSDGQHRKDHVWRRVEEFDRSMPCDEGVGK